MRLRDGIGNRRLPQMVVPAVPISAEEAAQKIIESPQEYEKTEVEKLKRYFMEVLQISRPPKTTQITVLTVPTLILPPPHEWPYLISNPSLAVGLTTSYTWTLAGVIASGNTQANPFGVANYLNCQFHINITNITGAATWDIWYQSRDPFTGNWGDVQTIAIGLSAALAPFPVTYPVPVGNFGIVTDLCLRYVKTGGAPADALTATITATLKEGIGGSSTGLARTIYLGGDDVTINTGLEIREGGKEIVKLGPDITLYAIAGTPIPIKVFTL
jgi:hypothetical protein